MDENRVEGAIENAAGTLQDSVGGLIGDSSMQAEGKTRQAAGTVKNAYGNAADGARDITNRVGEAAEQQPIAALLTIGAIGFFVGWMCGRRV